MSSLGKQLIYWFSVLIWLAISLPINLNAQCKYTFYASDTVACVNGVIDFKIYPKPPSGSKALWDFKTGKVNGTPNASYAFLSESIYDIGLRLTLPNNQVCVVNKRDYIAIGAKPDPGIVSVTPSLACEEGSKIVIKSTSLDAQKFSWTVGTTQIPSNNGTIVYTSSNNGKPDIQLVLEGNYGCNEKKSFSNLLTLRQKPEVNLGFKDTAICQYSVIHFKPKTNSFGQNNLEFLWTYENGSPSTSTKPLGEQVSYSIFGSFDVKLKITDPTTSCTWNYAFDDAVKVVQAPNISINVGGINPPGCADNSFSFGVLPSSILPKNIKWTVLTGRDSFQIDTTNALRAVVDFNYSGQYEVLFEYSANGCTKQIIKKVMASRNAITPFFLPEFDCLCKVPIQAKFSNRSTGSGPLTYLWQLEEFGKGVKNESTSTDYSPTISEFGKYKVRITTTNQQGCSEHYSYPFEVKAFEAIPSANTYKACPGASLDLKLADTLCFDSIASIEWTIYDTPNEKKYSTETIKHIFKNEGQFDIKISVTTKAGCSDEKLYNRLITIANLDNIEAVIDSPVICLGQEWAVSYQTNPPDFNVVPKGFIVNTATGDTINYSSFRIYETGNDIIRFIPNKPGFYDFYLFLETDICKDSFFKANAVFVQGVDFKLSSDKNDGCLTFTTQMFPTDIVNYTSNSSDTTLKYSWITGTPNRATIKSRYSRKTEIEIFKAGRVDVSLEIQNSSGCVSSVEKIRMFDVDVEPIFSVPGDYCSGVPLKIKNESRGDLAFREWSSSTGVIFKPNINTAEPQLEFPNTGEHEITLRVVGKDGCDLSLTKKIQIIDFEFDFEVVDNKPKCSPADFSFKITSKNVDSFFWNFGYGDYEKSSDSQFFKIFNLVDVSPYKNSFDITLVAKNNLGCTDTLRKEDLLQIFGPVPKFTFVNNVGCEPLQVTFIDSSFNVDKLFFNFGDNRTDNSGTITSHNYKITDSLVEYQVFRPYIVASDEKDCQFAAYASDSIIVYRNPKASFSLDTNKGCAPLKVAVYDSSTYTHKWFWDFNNDGIVDDTTAQPTTNLESGIHDIKLKVENAIGCPNTIIKRKALQSFSTPKVYFKSDTIACTNKQLQFLDNTFSEYKITRRHWDFGLSTRMDDTSNAANPIYKYPFEGAYDVSLFVIDENKCSDTLVKTNYISVFDKLPIDNFQINYITINDDNLVIINHSTIPEFAFRTYSVMRDGALGSLSRTNDINDTLKAFGDINVDLAPQCFNIRLEDVCNNLTNTQNHCTIHLTINPSNEKESELSWTPYAGWASIEKYVIYRKIEGSAYKAIDSVDGSTNHYTDSVVCDRTYTYRIKAVHPNKAFASNSNRASHKIAYVFQGVPLDVHLVTVNEKNQLLIKWDKSVQNNVEHYSVDRGQDFKPWNIGFATVNDTWLIDTTALIDYKWYSYRVSVVDECEHKSEPGNIGRSIFLQHSYFNRDAFVYWNHYNKWNQGVKVYNLYRRTDSTNFELHAAINGQDSYYIDTSAFGAFQKPYYYLVEAIENGVLPDTSFSNSIKVIPLPSLYAPTAFSPNGDGKNDEFILKGWALEDDVTEENFELQIFNRWGELIFQTNDIMEGWKGDFNGTNCEPGVFVWLAKSKGLNGSVTFMKGNVTLMR